MLKEHLAIGKEIKYIFKHCEKWNSKREKHAFLSCIFGKYPFA